MIRRGLQLAAIAVAGVLLTSCGPPDPVEPNEPTEQPSVSTSMTDEIEVALGIGEMPRMEALAENVTVVELDGCLAIRNESGSTPDAVLVVPADSGVDESGVELVTGERIDLGAVVSLAGGLSEGADERYSLPASCKTHPVWIVNDGRR